MPAANPSPVAQLRPNPWLAVNYALVFPGLGQLYSRHWRKGSGLAAGALALIGYALWSIFAANGNTVQGFWAIGLLLVLYSFNILDAYRGTQPHYGKPIAVPQGKKDIWYAVFLSQILPGLGHLYLQKAAIGGVFLTAGILTAWIANTVPAFIPIPPLIWALGCYHVYTQGPHRAQSSNAIALLVLGLFLVRLTLGGLPHWVHRSFEQCLVLSDSMVPTLQARDRLFVRRNPTYAPQIGDIVVFAPPAEALRDRDSTHPSPLYVKRLMGLPGQEIEVSGGRVFVDGEPLSEGYVQAPPQYQWGPASVPADSFFVLGDNRNVSIDSHVWGYVPAANLVGRAYKIYWPPARIQALHQRSAG
jgi:signal peptidase I